MKNQYLGAFALFALVTTSVPSVAFAATNELHYQSIEMLSGDDIIVRDQSPGGNGRYTCTLDGDCSKLRTTDEVKPPLLGNSDYLASSRGTYGIHELSIPIGITTTTFFTIYDMSDDEPRMIGIVSASGNILQKKFSPDESTFMVVTSGGLVTSYDINEKTSRTITIPQTELPFFNISYEGTYISAFSYTGNLHRIWNTRTGALTEIAGTPSYVEFSESEDEAAFLVDNNGFKNLSTATGFSSGRVSLEQVASGSFLVEDYLYADDTLFYMANKQSPLSWSIYKEGEREPIATDASYGDYLKRVDGMLAYLKIEGKNANVYLYDPEEDTNTMLDAAPASRSASNITRDEITIANRTAALLAPSKKRGDKNLFIWLHGGPQRQTSLNYHPYLSYAVYDELLEKLAAGGDYVLKLDYAGSWGYGQDFVDMLDRQVGVVEINDVEKAIAAFKKKYDDVENVYLIGNSYGGYMAFRAINDHPDLIDGIVSINGVADWSQLISAIPSSPFNELFDGVPAPHNLSLYQNASVFSKANAIDDETPLLVFYGTEDRTVPTNQSLQYDVAMRTYGKNVILTAFEGEEHVLRKRSTLTELCETITDELSLRDVDCR